MSKPLALVIEDDNDLSTIFAQALQAADFDVEVIQSGDVALAKLATLAPYLIVLDMHLPRVSGMEILRHVQQDNRLAGVHVIVTTADSQRADELSEQVDLALVKPISFSQLRDMASRFRSAA